MSNVINLIYLDLSRHRARVILPGEQEERLLYLVMIKAKTSKFEDFKKTYGEQATATHLKIAKKIFGEKETENIYGIFVDEELRMVYAFNRDFADYNKKENKVIYKDVDDVLLENIIPLTPVIPGDSDFPTIPIPKIPKKNFPPDGGITILYSLAEKE